MKVLNISNGDYKVVTKTDGQITLDVGNNGLVLITGDLQVAGDVTTIQSETLTVRDNIIQLNVDDPGDATGISAPLLNRESGLEINRGGTKPKAYLVFSDAVSSIRSTASSAVGTFVFKDATGASIGIETPSIKTVTNGNLYLINQGSGIVTVTGTVDYERNVFDYTNFELVPPTGPLAIIDADALPNVQALKDYVDSNLAFFDDYSISEDDTVVECIDKDAANYFRTLLDPLYVLPAASKISFRVDGNERGQFTTSGLFVDNINLFTDTVDNTTNNLILSATTTSTVEVDAVLQINDTGLNPTAVSGSTKIYTVDSDTTPAPGKTGIYFVNQGNTDELVSKNRALLFSILF